MQFRIEDDRRCWQRMTRKATDIQLARIIDGPSLEGVKSMARLEQRRRQDVVGHCAVASDFELDTLARKGADAFTRRTAKAELERRERGT